MSELNVLVVGAGGIGKSLIPNVAHFLHYSYPGSVLTIADSDVYERLNAPGQRFSQIGNKAIVTALELSAEYGDITVIPIPELVTLENIYEFMYDGVIVLLAVDNHPTRKLFSQAAQNILNVTIVSGSTDMKEGLVQIFRRIDGKNYHITLANPFQSDIQDASSEIPLPVPREGCEQREQSTPELFVTNVLVAASMLAGMYACIEGTVCCDEIHVDVIGPNFRTEKRPNQE